MNQSSSKNPLRFSVPKTKIAIFKPHNTSLFQHKPSFHTRCPSRLSQPIYHCVESKKPFNIQTLAHRYFCNPNNNNAQIQKQGDQDLSAIPYAGTASSVDMPDWSKLDAHKPETQQETVTNSYRMSEALKYRSTKTGLGIGVYAINPETGKKEKRTTGLVGLNVNPNGRIDLMDLYYKNLVKIQEMPEDYALRKVLEASYRWRLEVLETTEDHEEIEEKLESGQIEEMIWAAENDSSGIELIIEQKMWQPPEKYHAVPFIWKPQAQPTTIYSKDHGRYEKPPQK